MITGIEYTDESNTRIITDRNMAKFEPQSFDVEEFFKKPIRFEHEKEIRFLWAASWQTEVSDNIKGANIREDWRIVDSSGLPIHKKLIDLKHADICDNHGRPARLPGRSISKITSLASAVRQAI